MISVDICCDLMDEDETGFVWAFLRETRDPGLVEPGAIVLVGDADAPAVAEVIDINEKPVGQDRAPSSPSRSDRGLRSARPPLDHTGLKRFEG